MEIEERYPYLGEKDGVIVFFASKNFGTVVKSDNPNFPFGMIDYFNEADFTFVSPDKVIIKVNN